MTFQAELLLEPIPGEVFQQLRELEAANLRPGSDIRKEAYAIAGRVPELLRNLEQCDAELDTYPGHASLLARRRHGIFRHLMIDSVNAGLPLSAPLAPPPPSRTQWPNIDIHWCYLADELEYCPIWIVKTDYGWRPACAIMTSFQMRAVFGWPASYFYELNRQCVIPGKRLEEEVEVELPVRHLQLYFTEARYDTETVMRWWFEKTYRPWLKKQKA